nr:hypothetical protein [uncultured Dongia sp.]
MVMLMVSAMVSACATISSVPRDDSEASGFGYALPKGLVPVRVFADAKGVGLTIEPAQMVADTDPGALVARIDLSVFNDEDVKVTVDPQTAFLKTITSNSDAKLQEIVTEAAKAAAKFAFQNGRATTLAEQVIVYEDSLDPLNPTDLERVNRGIAAAFGRATQAFAGATHAALSVPKVVLSVAMPDGSHATQPLQHLDLKACRDGLCVRTITTRLIRVDVDGAPFASKAVNIPSREIVAIPVPTTILADQDITIGITDGMLDKYEIKRGSEALGLVKTIGAIPGALVSGATEQLTGQKSIVDKQKELADSTAELNKSQQALSETTMKFQNNVPGGSVKSSYAAITLTVYPHSETLTRAIEQRIEADKNAPKPPSPPGPGGDGGLTIDPVPLPAPGN